MPKRVIIKPDGTKILSYKRGRKYHIHTFLFWEQKHYFVHNWKGDYVCPVCGKR